MSWADLGGEDCCCEYCVAKSFWLDRIVFLATAWMDPNSNWSYTFYFRIRKEMALAGKREPESGR